MFLVPFLKKRNVFSRLKIASPLTTPMAVWLSACRRGVNRATTNERTLLELRPVPHRAHPWEHQQDLFQELQVAHNCISTQLSDETRQKARRWHGGMQIFCKTCRLMS